MKKNKIIEEIKKKGANEENIWNIPNSLTLGRVLITFLTIYFIFADFNLYTIAILFSIGMITDFLDGQIARRFNMTTEFGRRFDMIADRFLMIGTALAITIAFSMRGMFDSTQISQIFLIMSREIISFPFALMALSTGKDLPKARFIGKLTTTMQGITFPAIIISVYYPVFEFSYYLAILTSIIGAISAFYYINDVWGSKNKNERAR